MAGKVYLVGAGPGDPGLFTLKGKAVLAQADVVVYDALVGPGVLAMAPANAKLIDVGKRAGNHKMPQEEMNRVLLREAQEGHVVVRLKGGDPFLFGRGGEELELLAENGIPFEIVPGITSAISVPAYNGIPVTHRDFCSSVHIVTGHKRKGSEYDIDFESLVRTGGTLVFLMGVTSLESICGGLVSAGMDPQTPAAVLQEGTTAGQRRVVADLTTLKEEAERAGIEAPAIIVVGKVCSLAERFHWFEQLPLQGLRVVVTRPKELISGMADRLRRQGAEVIEFPAIRTEAICPNAALEEAFRKIAEGTSYHKTEGVCAPAYDRMAFTSPTGVRIFFEAFLKEHDIRDLCGIRIAAIGKGSEKALAGYGLKADFVPTVYDGETLGRELGAEVAPGERILIPRARIGNPELVEELEKAGAKVTEIATYETIHAAGGPVDVAGMLAAGRIDACVFTSASTVSAFAEALAGADLSAVTAVCIGKQTRARAESFGMKTLTAEQATMNSVIAKIAEKADELRAARDERLHWVHP